MTDTANIGIGVFGLGRLGSSIAEAIGRSPGLELAWVSGRGDGPGYGADVAIDASAAGAVVGHLAWALESGTCLVIGATGWDLSILDEPKARPLDIGVMVAPNFSMAAAFMRRVAVALGRLASGDPETDLSIVERHHRGKADAPSGTAKLLAAALAVGSGRHSGWSLGKAEGGAISVASLRSGSAVGYHELRYEAPLETLVVSHEALDRRLFAQGAIDAARWIAGKRGVFCFDDMAAEILDALFSAQAENGRPASGPSLAGRRKES